MRRAIAALMIWAMASGATATLARQPTHASPWRAARGTAGVIAPRALPDESGLSRAVLNTRPLPVIRLYFPREYWQIVASAHQASRAGESETEIAGAIEALSNAFMARMSPYYDTGNMIEYMVVLRDTLRAMTDEMPGACVDFMRFDGRMSPAAREKLALMMARQPGWRLDVMEASLRQAATHPAKPVAGESNPIALKAIREIAVQGVPESLRTYLHPMDAAAEASPRESEAMCRYASGVISASLQLPPEQAVGVFKQIARPGSGL